MEQKFIKVINPDIARYLVSLGFQYVKEQNVFAFTTSDELLKVINSKFKNVAFVAENKLRF